MMIMLGRTRTLIIAYGFMAYGSKQAHAYRKDFRTAPTRQNITHTHQLSARASGERDRI